eukprot:15473521-Alexandrium_andersonii.AAC.1
MARWPQCSSCGRACMVPGALKSSEGTAVTEAAIPGERARGDSPSDAEGGDGSAGLSPTRAPRPSMPGAGPGIKMEVHAPLAE